MLFVLLILFQSVNGFINISLTNFERHELVTCISRILNEHHSEDKQVTYVDMSSEMNILQEVENEVSLSFVSRTSKVRLAQFNENYLIHAANAENFTEHFHQLTKDKHWNPRAKFLVILNYVDDLKDVFDQLLKYHVMNVLVVGGSDMDLYTYAPLENSGCGKRYDRIKHYGKCSDPKFGDLFPARKGSLQNCTLNIEAAHWPPFSIDPKLQNFPGIEQFILNVFSDSYHVKLNYTYATFAETVALITTNLKAVGSLEKLQNNEVDANIGGMLLLTSRGEGFDYVWSHLPYADKFVILVKKSRGLATWKYTYKEFPISAWIMLLLAFTVYCVVMMIGFPIKDKSSFVLKIFGSLLGRGVMTTLPNTPLTRLALIYWVWFAYLISLHYSTSLTSLTTRPLKLYQISKVEDLKTYEMKSCVSSVMQEGMRVLSTKMPLDSYEKYPQGCKRHLQSIETVSETDGAFTITFGSIYTYHKQKFRDESGSKIYSFKEPLNYVMYGMYFYKGFPILDELHKHGLRMQESGLIQVALEAAKIDSRTSTSKKVRQPKGAVVFVLPWCILMFGATVSIVVYVVELLMGLKKTL